MKYLLIALMLLVSDVAYAREVDLNSCIIQDNYDGETDPHGVWMVCQGRSYKIVTDLSAYKNGITLREIVGNSGCLKEQKHVGYITEYALGGIEKPYVKIVINGEEKYLEVVNEFEPCNQRLGYRKWQKMVTNPPNLIGSKEENKAWFEWDSYASRCGYSQTEMQYINSYLEDK